MLTTAGCDHALGSTLNCCWSFVLGVGRERLVIDAGAELRLGRDELDSIRGSFLARRQAREPVAYIVGRKAFRRISLTVDRRVLIPRPETELLVEVALSLALEARGSRMSGPGAGRSRWP